MRWIVGWSFLPMLLACVGEAQTDATGDDDPTGGTTASPLTHDDVESLCAEQRTHADCHAVPEAEGGSDLSWCAWETWIAVTVDADGACAYGDVDEVCGYQHGSDLCDSYSQACNGWSYGAWDGARVGFSNKWCVAPFETCYDDMQPVPECACLCADMWPL
jgi:hypothetical protein